MSKVLTEKKELAGKAQEAQVKEVEAMVSDGLF